MAWFRRIWNTLRPGHAHRDIDRELAFHLAESADEFRAQGMTDEEALQRARRRFNGVTANAEITREADSTVWLDGFLRNIRFGFRAIVRTPVLAVTIILILALGIGANTAVFAAFNAIILQPLPFPDSARLMRVTQTQEKSAETFVAPVRLEDWNRLNSTFETITGYFVEDVSETSGDLPERVRRGSVAPRFLETLGVPPEIGRDFEPKEHRVGGPSAAVISDRYWRRRFNGDPGALNQSVRIAGLTFSIVGIMPASFQFPDREVDIWVPSPVDAPYAQARISTWYIGIGRLRVGVTQQQATLNLRSVQDKLGEEYPNTDRAISVEVVSLKETVTGQYRGSLWLLFGAVTTLLLIACTNIAALLLSRAQSRHKEIAVRFALGGSRRAVVAQMLVETGMLALAGAVLGVFVAAGALALFRSLGPTLPRGDEITPNRWFFVYTFACAMAVTLVCGVLPAIQGTANNTAGHLAKAGRTYASTRHPLQWLLVAIQVSLSVILLTVGGLFLRSFQELSRVSSGFDPTQVLTFRVSGNFAETADYGQLLTRIERRLDELRSLPSVEETATSSMFPGVPDGYETTFELAGGRAETQPTLIGESRSVSPSYFATLKIPLLSGELCRRQSLGAGTDVMVNRTFANRYFVGVDVIGQQLSGPTYLAPGRIVGIVADARERGINSDVPPTVYWCFSAPNPTPAFLVRTRGKVTALVQPVRQKIRELEAGRAVYDFQPLEQRIGGAFAQDRLRTALVVFFAVTALLLACIGLFGTLSYTANLRRREIGLRLALGAMRGTIVRELVSKSLQFVGLATAIGIVVSAALSRGLSGMLYGVSTSDPITLTSVVVLVLGLAGLTSLLPAARVAFLDPVKVLREE